LSTNIFVSANPGRDVQRVGTAQFLGENVAKIHGPVWGVTGSLGDSQCYLGVLGKVAAIQKALSERIRRDELPVRLIAPAYTIGVSDTTRLPTRSYASIEPVPFDPPSPP
jgi:dihydroxy-acid dehydratase